MATRPPVYGQMSEFLSETESYVERAKIFFAANEIPDDKQPAVFLSVIGGKTYTLLRSLLSLDLPQDQTLEDIVAALESHFDPKPIVIAERFHFHRRNQLPNESVAVYVAELRRLSTHCDFREYLNEALRDRLVCGLRNESAQKRLLSEKELTFKKAKELAQSMEAAESNTRALQRTETAAVNRLTKPHPRNAPSSAHASHRCGKTNHIAPNCRFIDATCRKCG